MPQKTVCVDLDGVLADNTKDQGSSFELGEPIAGSVEFVRRLARFSEVVVFTARLGEDASNPARIYLLRRKIKRWLDEHGYPYSNVYVGQGKPLAAAFIDDRAVECEPQVEGSSATYDRAVKRVKKLCEER